jgi:5-formyltetrahydrofolate cyclo-ligase
MDKTELRLKLQKCLLEMPEGQRKDKSKSACRNLISTPEFQKATAIMLYISLPHEVDTSEVILYAWQCGKVVAVPKISWQQRHMIPVQINSLETGFSVEASGLRNPVTGVPMPLEEIDGWGGAVPIMTGSLQMKSSMRPGAVSLLPSRRLIRFR